MDEQDLRLSQQCEAVAAAASDATSWIKEAAPNAPTVAQAASSLVAELQKVRNQSRKLARAARRRMCVGVFGPSQAGKSYLVSILAARPDKPLKAIFDGKAYDFLSEINPPGNRESTGLVTRISAVRGETPPGFPVEIRLLTQTDIVKILANSFLMDFDREKVDVTRKGQEMTRPDPEAIRRRLSEMRSLAQAAPVGDLSEDDVLDLQEYFDSFFANSTADFRIDFWREAVQLAPRLPGRERGRLWSMLWWDFKPFTELYQQLYEGLRMLGFADEALCQMAALHPRESSIIDVQTLNKLGADDSDKLTVRPRKSGAPDAQLPRSLVCALTAELRIAIDEKPWPFFDHTDLLDFPGARSRLKLASLDDVAKVKGVAEGANPMRELLLRGKVAYLFQRYSAERELTGILLCIPDGNQEVRDLSDMLAYWIDYTQGPTPEARMKQRNSLFLVLTKMDREFEQKAGETDESRALRWGARLNNSLLNNFRGDWPRNWNGRPFANTFWLRNPTVVDERLMRYEGEGDKKKEVSIADGFRQRHATLRGEFAASEPVRQHFAEPERAWDEAFLPNDGGVSYIVEKLTPVCDPQIKRNQVRGQIEQQMRTLLERLAGFHSGDASDARQKKLQQAQRIIAGLRECVAMQRFGELLSAMQVEDGDLRSVYLRAAQNRDEDDDKPKNGGPRVRTAVGGGIDTDSIFDSLLGEEGAAQAAIDGAGERMVDRAERFAGEAAARWLENVRRLGGDEKALAYLSVPRQHYGWLADELAVALHRIRVVESLAGKVRGVENAANAKWDEVAERQVRVAANAINGFVAYLGFDALPLGERPGVPVDAPKRRVFAPPAPVEGPPSLGEQPTATYAVYCGDWLTAFRQLALDNVGYEGGRDITPAQNDRLGAILRMVESARSALVA